MKPFSLIAVVLCLASLTTFAETEPNNSASQANTFAYNGSDSGSLTSTDPEDWFVINIPQGGVYTMTVKKIGGGDGRLVFIDGEKSGYPEISNLYLSYGDSPAQGWMLTIPVLKGKYYAKFQRYNDQLNYQVSCALALPGYAEDPESNDTIATAQVMPLNGTTSGTLHYYKPGKGYDYRDWYMITIPQAGILNVTVNKKSNGNTWFSFKDLLRTGENSLSNFYFDYNVSPADGWKWTYPVLAGTYYFQIEGGSGTVDYSLQVSLVTPAFPEDTEPNDTVTKALVMQLPGSVSGNVHYHASGKDFDWEDWYKLVVPKGGILNLKIHKKGPGNSWLHFRDNVKGLPELKNFYLDYADSPTGGWTWDYPVLAGTYYFQVQGGGGVVDYKLDLSLADPAFAEDAEPNDTVTKALIMPVNGSVTGNVHYHAAGKDFDWEDWYKLVVPKGGILNLKIHKKGPGNSWLHFRDGLKAGLPEIANYYFDYFETSAEGNKWSYPVLAGTYYFQVQGGGGVLDYKIESSLADPTFTEDVEPNDTVTKALTMPSGGPVSGNVHYYTCGKGTDQEDWYKLTVAAGGILNITFYKKGTGNSYMHFRDGLKAGLPEISSFYFDFWESPAEGTNWRFPVLAGVYYVQIQGGSGIVDYKMDVSVASPAFPEDSESNDTITKAVTVYPVDTITGTLHYYKDGKGYDEEDWYKLTVTRGGILTLKIFKKGPGNTYMHFRDGEKKNSPEIATYYFDYSETKPEGNSWSYPVLSGIYYIQIQGGGNVVDYRMELQQPVPMWGEDKEPNDSLKYALKINVKDSIGGLLGYYKPGYGFDDWDWYEIVTREYGYLTFSLMKKGTNNGNIHIRDTLNEIGTQYIDYWDNLNVVWGKQVPAGKYFIGIQKYGGDLQYRANGRLMPKPTADFSWIQTDNAYAFENKTADGETYWWNFDDGKESTATNPLHEYLKPGNYDVTLVAQNKAGKDTIRHRIVLPGFDRIFPSRAGNSGDVTMIVYGGGLDTLYKIRLEQNGSPIVTAARTFFGGKSGISATLDLRDKPVGVYDVVIEKKGGPVYKLPSCFYIEKGNKAEPWARLEGRNRILFNTTTTYKISFGNSGNVDATGVPLWIAISDLPGLTAEFSGMEIKIPSYVYEKNLMNAYNSVDMFFRADTVMGKPFKSKVYVFYIPVIPAGYSSQITLKLKTPQNIKVMVWVNDPYYESPMKGSFAACVASVFAEGIIDAGTSAIPAVGCITQGLKSVYTLFSPFPGQPEQGNTWGSWLKGFAVSLVDCGISLTGVGAVVKAMGVLFANSYLYKEKLDDCKKAFMGKNPNEQEIAAVSSLDPNEKAGPSGFGKENFIAANRHFPYTVYFENKSTATAPAHTVAITDQLDLTKFDPSTFSFGDIYIGDSLISVKPGLKQFAADKKLDKLKVVARVTGKLDTLTGKLEWTLRSLDPSTLDDTEDPDLGILPPNVVSPQGQGSVSFYVRLKDDPVHKATVTNQASIVFDANPAIITNKHLTTFDLAAPQSMVQSLTASTTARQFTVKWSGTDDGSGIGTYNIYMKKNNDPFTIWLAGTTETSALFKSPSDGTFQFASVAVDQTGNSEDFPLVADASTNVVTAVDKTDISDQEIQVYPTSPGSGMIVNIGIPGRFTFRIFGSDGRLRMEKRLEGISISTIKTGALIQGLYLWHLTNQDVTVQKSGKFILTGR